MNRSREDVALVRESGLFDEAWYLRRYPDVARVGLDPAEHFVRFGGLLGRAPSAAFDTGYYLEAYPDVATAGLNPLVHFLLHGRAAGRLARRAPTPQALPPVDAEPGAATAEPFQSELPINRIPGRRAPVEGGRTLASTCTSMTQGRLLRMAVSSAPRRSSLFVTVTPSAPAARAQAAKSGL